MYARGFGRRGSGVECVWMSMGWKLDFQCNACQSITKCLSKFSVGDSGGVRIMKANA